MYSNSKLMVNIFILNTLYLINWAQQNKAKFLLGKNQTILFQSNLCFCSFILNLLWHPCVVFYGYEHLWIWILSSELNLILGESGLGKSTLINSLFLTDLYSADYQGPSHRIQKTVKVGPSTVQATILPLSRPSVYHCSCYWYTTVQAIRLLVYHLDYHYTTVQTTSTPLSKLLVYHLDY